MKNFNKNEKIHERVEVFNLRNKLCQEDFKEKTTNTDKFTSCFEGDETIDVQFKRWHRRLLKTLHSCFRKVRVKNIEDAIKVDILIEEKKLILKKKNLDKIDTQKS